MVLTTVSVDVLITETEFEKKFTTYTFVPSGATANPCGLDPTGMSLMTVCVAVSTTETELECWFAIYARLLSGKKSTPHGPLPTVIVATTVSHKSVAMTETVLVAEFAT
jgi:hypothetical protein